MVRLGYSVGKPLRGSRTSRVLCSRPSGELRGADRRGCIAQGRLADAASTYHRQTQLGSPRVTRANAPHAAAANCVRIAANRAQPQNTLAPPIGRAKLSSESTRDCTQNRQKKSNKTSPSTRLLHIAFPGARSSRFRRGLRRFRTGLKQAPPRVLPGLSAHPPEHFVGCTAGFLRGLAGSSHSS